MAIAARPPCIAWLGLQAVSLINATWNIHSAAALLSPLTGSLRLLQCFELLHTTICLLVTLAAPATAAGLSRLASKLVAEAPAGCTLLSYIFKVPGWEQQLQAMLPVTSGKPGRPDVSGVSKLYIYRTS
jgi:hypothetical protein